MKRNCLKCAILCAVLPVGLSGLIGYEVGALCAYFKVNANIAFPIAGFSGFMSGQAFALACRMIYAYYRVKPKTEPEKVITCQQTPIQN